MNPDGHCHATTREGSPCGAPALRDRDFCFSHDPDSRDAADEARRQGGQQRSRQMTRPVLDPTDPKPAWWPLQTAHQARAGLAFVAQEILQGRLAARDGNAATGALSALANVLRDATLEDRLQALEALLAQRGPS